MKTKEVWKDVKGYEGHYKVSNLGRVKSIKYNKEQILKSVIDKMGYYPVVLSLKGSRSNILIHQLVAIGFLNHTRCGHKIVVNHINFNKSDNRVENLELITQRENANKKHLKSSSKYIGVGWCKPMDKWRTQIRTANGNKHLGYFDSELDASNAYQKALKKLQL